MKLSIVKFCGVLFFFLSASSLSFGQIISQNSNFYYLFDDIAFGQSRIVSKAGDEINFLINNKLLNKYTCKQSSKLNITASENKQYFILCEYTFGGKNDMTQLEIQVFNKDFSTSFKKSLEFYYEEKLPVTSLTNDGKIVLFFPHTAELRQHDKNSSMSISLEKDLVYNIERNGFVLSNEKELIVVLTDINLKSKIYFLDDELNQLKQETLNYQHINRIFKFNNNSIMISAYNFETELQPVLLKIEHNKMSTIGEILVDGAIGGTDMYLYNSNKIYTYQNKKLIEKYSVINGNIISAHFFENKFHLLIRQDNRLILESISNDFKILRSIKLEKNDDVSGFYFSETEKKLFLKTKNQFLSLN